jgi:acetylornithine deacetylase/succinyl-diaminopimelate desuccinylase-like protein
LTFTNRTAELCELLSYVRPDRSQGQREFIKRFIKPLGVMADKAGNYWKYVGDKNPRVLWSCHTDTVHKGKGVRQNVDTNKEGMVCGDGSDVLGADDGAGVFLARELIQANVPGLYLFHAAEEIGGLGSQWIAKKRSKRLIGIDFAIALDRAGKEDVLTHQAGLRCCSDAFAESLSDQLNKAGMQYRPDDSGVFTDTANYTDLIGECTNISVGYEKAHTKGEYLDAEHLFDLAEALKGLDISKLEAKRQPGDFEELSYQIDTADFNKKSTFDDWMDGVWANYTMPGRDRMANIIANNPDAIASLLEDYGFNADDLHTYIRGAR